MKLAVSNIALSPYDHSAEVAKLADLGFQGLEVALSRVWRQDWNRPSPTAVESYRHMIETAGLGIVGLHSLFWQEPELSLFGDREVRNRTLDFLEQLSRVCRDLGGRTLIYGSRTARTRGDLTKADADRQAVRFFQDLCQRIEGHGTCYCFEPLEPEAADYINSVLDALTVVRSVDHPALRIQMDAKALMANHEADEATFQAVAAELVHFHANQPDLGVLESQGPVDHALLGRLLRGIGYQGYVSIEQRLVNPGDVLGDVARSRAVLEDCYRLSKEG